MSAQRPPRKDGYFCVAVVLGAHGIRGGVRLKAFTADPADVAAYGAPVDTRGKAFSLSRIKVTPKGVLAHIDGLNDRDAAEALKGTYLYAPLSALPDDGGVYYGELEAMMVVRENAEPVGTIDYVFDAGANPVLSVRLTNGGDVMIPFIDDVVVRVDKAAAQVIVSDAVDMFLGL
ncbi:MAG: 16S rRNA processing protein RimM [Proteobacteria bacterium]|nr:16S rRNA processing protein RimM [Pseudomonadota bacterium]